MGDDDDKGRLGGWIMVETMSCTSAGERLTSMLAACMLPSSRFGGPRSLRPAEMGNSSDNAEVREREVVQWTS